MKVVHTIIFVCFLLLGGLSALSWAQQAPTFEEPLAVGLPTPSPMPLFTILFEMSGNGTPANPPFIEDELFACDEDAEERCMNGYWREVSYGDFEFENAGVTAWIPAWDDPDTQEDESSVTFWWGPDWDGVDGHAEDEGGFRYRWWALKSLLESGFPVGEFLSDYDVIKDGRIILGREIAIQIIDNRPWCAGATRETLGREIDGITLVGGIAVTHGGEVNGCGTYNPQPFYIYAHELGHSLWESRSKATVDIVWDSYGGKTRPEPILHYNLWGGDYGPLHPPSYIKMKLGWLEPYENINVILKDGWYEIPNIELNRAAVLLHDPSHGKHEYFLVENRWKGETYDNTYLNYPSNVANPTPPGTDAGIMDQGLVVWHVDENKPRYQNDAGDVSRLQLVPRLKVAGDDYVNSAWDGSEEDFYPLYDYSWPANTRWWDGSPSGTGIWAASAAGPSMRAYFDVPGPGVLVIPEEIEIRRAPGGISTFDLHVTNTGEAVDIFTFDIEGFGELYGELHLDVPGTGLPVDPKSTKTVQATVTSPVLDPCSLGSYRDNYSINIQSSINHAPAASIPVDITFKGVLPVPDLSPQVLSVFPGDNADFDLNVENVGNATGDITFEFKGFELSGREEAEPRSIPEKWVGHFPRAPRQIDYCGGSYQKIAVQIRVPVSWSGMQDTTYRFAVIARSVTTPDNMGLAEGFLTIQATPLSMIRYNLQRILSTEQAVKIESLKAKVTTAADRTRFAMARYEAGDIPVAKNNLNAARLQLKAFILEGKALKNTMTYSKELSLWVGQAEGIVSDLDATIEQLLVKR